MTNGQGSQAAVSGFACVRCGAPVDHDDLWQGCRSCSRQGIAANAVATGQAQEGERIARDPTRPGLFGYQAWLSIPDRADVVSLGEGSTPALRLSGLARELGVAEVLLKDETRNPTWSYKDRLAAMAVSAAKAAGADTVALSTTGNHGAATAAYAALAGLRCLAFTLTSVPRTMKVLMQTYGAEVVALDRPEDRWALLRQGVQERGWVPISGFLDPPIGSNPHGIDGYRTIAYELVEQLTQPPTVVVVPTAYADGLTGIWLGFTDLVRTGQLRRLPRLVVTDPFGAYAAARDTSDDDSHDAGATRGNPVPVRISPAGSTPAFNIATSIATQQGLEALDDSRGTATGPHGAGELMAAQAEFGARWGHYLEASSAITLLAARDVAARGWLNEDDVVVLVGTSSGLKDVDATAATLPDVPTIQPTLDQLDGALS